MTTVIVPVTELKTNLAKLLERLETDGSPVYVTLHGKAKAVLVKYAEYEALQEKVEDLEDALAMMQALASPPEEAISLEAYEQRAAKVRR
ncbi:MAG: type II toxin-antitoxin system Phd/YefM family antitoxin [Chloroflexi bacterium]|nr:type II toxin-antitoxin system Phd/YefM family antitoxin [Chloroflexota bacterium]